MFITCLSGVAPAVCPSPPQAPPTKPFLPHAAAGTNPLAVSQKTYAFQDAYPLSVENGTEAHAVLEVRQARLRSGQPLTVDIRFCNDRVWDNFYNLYWNKLIPPPGFVALYDARKQFVGNVSDLDEEIGSHSHRAPSPGDWTAIQSGGYVGMHLGVSLATLHEHPLKLVPVAAGTYYLQVIYFNRFIAPASVGPQALFVNDSSTQELFRSNAVKIIVTE